MALVIAETLLDFVRRNLPAERQRILTIDSRLLSEGIIDSLGIALLTTFIEETFEVRFDDTELSEGGLETLRTIATTIERRRR